MPERIANIERLRILAAFGIVWFHTEGAWGRSIGYAGLPIFIMMFCMLIKVKEGESFKDFAIKKAKRLWLPWGFWCIVYLIAGLVKATIKKESAIQFFPENAVLTGTSIHLWYLPFAFLISLVINRIQRINIKLNGNIPLFLTVAFGAFGIFSSSYLLSNNKIPAPFAQWLFGLPACIIGWGIGNLLRNENKCGIIITSMIMAILCFAMQLYGISGLAFPYGIGTILLSIAITLPEKTDKFTQFVAPLTFGVYLIHPLIGSLINIIVKQPIAPSIAIALSFVISACVSAVLMKTKIKAMI